MKYMGSKNRIAKQLLPIILEDRIESQYYVEPFVGGGNMIDKVSGLRIGSDSNEYLIECLKIISTDPHLLPDLVTEGQYSYLKSNYNIYTNAVDKGIIGYIAFSMSFGGKWFGGYRRDVKGSKGCMDNMITQSRRSKNSALKQFTGLKEVEFYCSSYDKLDIPENSIIYCDPPYANTTKYKSSFDSNKFWDWCRYMHSVGHKVFISEYNAPDDFKCVKEINHHTTLDTTNSKTRIEKLYSL